MGPGPAQASEQFRDGFLGWDMYTHAVPPWIGDDKTSRDFNEVHNDFMELINSNKFELSENVIYPEDRLFSTLMWRHYHVFWSVKFINIDAIPRHPSQIYEALFEGLVLFFLLNYLAKKKRFGTPGIISSIFLIFYSLFRFVLEFFRAPDPQIGYVLLNLTMGQLV